MNAYDAQTVKLSDLRERAYTAALIAVRTHERWRPQDIRRLVEDMHLYQSELEKQIEQWQEANDDLRASRKHLEQELLQAQKMESVGRLAGGLAHDFNNLLTAILGNIEWMETALKESSVEVGELTAQLEQIDHAAQRAASLTRPLLAFSRRRAEAVEALNLNELIQELETMFARLVGEDILLEVDLSPHLANIRADAGQIQQILMNLVVNARDAMPQGGRLTFKTADASRPSSLTDSTAHTGPYVMLAVTDTGVGMTPEVLNHIFEPFFTTKSAEQGTGLGLSTAYGIIKQAGGYINVTSEPDRGSVFEIYFPAIEEEIVAAPESKANGHERGSETILICEDEPMVRELTSRALRTKGYNVLVAEDSLTAATLVAQHTGPIHLLVSDVIMPGLSGHKLADLVRPDHPEMKVLFVSGYPADVLDRRGLSSPEAEFLEKPFTPSALVKRVREVLSAT